LQTADAQEIAIVGQQLFEAGTRPVDQLDFRFLGEVAEAMLPR
jgi:hypothetical protein